MKSDLLKTDLPLLLLPGLLCDQAVWSHQIEGLSDLFDCTVAQLATQDTIRAMAEDALASVDGPFALAGHSMGGYVALEIMRLAPERVQRLALLSTQPRADSEEQAKRRHSFVENARRGEFSDVVAGFPPLLFHETRLGDVELVDDFTAMAHRVGGEGFFNQQAAIMGRADSVTSLQAIACPTLVLCGRQDLITPIEGSQLMAERVAGARFVILEDCGHMTLVEEPVAVNDALRAWARQS